MPSSPRIARARRLAVYGAAAVVLGGTAAGTSTSGAPASSAGSTRASSGTRTALVVATQDDKSRQKKSHIPCATPKTTGSVASQSEAADKAAARGKAWTGVLERVLVKLNGDGSVNGTPSQHTRVSASGTEPVTVSVPVSGPISKRKKAGGGTSVVHHEAQVSLDPDGSAQQLVKSDFNRPLPVKVNVTYHLNGKPISASQVNGESGTVKVTYTLSNVSARSMSACFEGFNGEQQHITLKTPLPILAWLYFTVPSEADTFSAPGSSLSPDNQGVDVGWTAALFRPFGPTKRTFTLTMKTSQATIPAATLWLDTVSPFTLSGDAPTASAQAVGTAAAAVAKGQADVQEALASVQHAATALENSTSSSSRSSRTRAGSGSGAVRDQSAALGQLLALLGADLGELRTSLHQQASDATKLSRAADATAELAATINTLAGQVTTQVDALTARQSEAVQNAVAQVQQLEQLSADLQALTPDLQNTPEILKLAADLAVAKTTAGKVSGAVTDAEQVGQSVADNLQRLQADVTTLVSRADALQSAAASLNERAHQVVDQRLTAIDRHYHAFQRRFAKFQDRFAALRARIATVAASIKARFERARATARQDLANLLLKGEQALQTSADEAQTQLDATEAQTRDDLAKANTQYATLLTLDQQADLYQLPGGTAPDVSEQSGVYFFKISGTSGSQQRQDTRQNRREQRQNARQERRQHRQDKRQERRQQRQDNRQERRQERQANR